MDIHYSRRTLRDRLYRLRRSSHLCRLHRRTRNCRRWHCRHLHWLGSHLRRLAPFAETAEIPGSPGRNIRPCIHCWTFTWRRLHDKGHLAVVFLDKYTDRWRGHRWAALAPAGQATAEKICGTIVHAV